VSGTTTANSSSFSYFGQQYLLPGRSRLSSDLLQSRVGHPSMLSTSLLWPCKWNSGYRLITATEAAPLGNLRSAIFTLFTVTLFVHQVYLVSINATTVEYLHMQGMQEQESESLRRVYSCWDIRCVSQSTRFVTWVTIRTGPVDEHAGNGIRNGAELRRRGIYGGSMV
jgi:hypothetical protein